VAAQKAEKKKVAEEKRAKQARRDAADKKVDHMLKVKGFEAQLKAKGEANKKKRKRILEKAFSVNAKDRKQLLAEHKERTATKTKRNKTDNEDQVSWIAFKKGSTGKDPPDGDTKNEAKTVYMSGATAMAKQVFKYNFS
jgi:hypothetical protein